MTPEASVFPVSGHDHHSCVRIALSNAERLCRQQGLRLTAIRRRVLELIWQSHRPSGAYELLEQLAAEGRKPSPPTVYRALDFLLAHGLVHRISSRNAYVGCSRPREAHMAQIFICDHCGVALEQADSTLSRCIQRNAETLQFEIHAQTVEIIGLCPHCAGRSDAA
jgi:Fur family zinc uptake transcriptional regulator